MPGLSETASPESRLPLLGSLADPGRLARHAVSAGPDPGYRENHSAPISAKTLFSAKTFRTYKANSLRHKELFA
jgi:hypothetical protein